MKGYWFYLECDKKKCNSKGEGTHRGNCLAVTTKCRSPYVNRNGRYEGASAVSFEPNANCCWGEFSPDFVRESCIRVSEETARRIHPKLFAYLDSYRLS